MSRVSRSLALLCLFTTRDKAESIVGDLIEESRGRGRLWYWPRAAGIALALGFTGIRLAPLRSLALAVVGRAVDWCIAMTVFAASGLLWYPWNRMSDPQFLLRLSLAVLAAKLLTGFVLGRWVSVKGTNALGPLVSISLALWPISLVAGALIYRADLLSFWIAGLLAYPFLDLLPLAIGGALGHRTERALDST